jgi:hypothetical protein
MLINFISDYCFALLQENRNRGGTSQEIALMSYDVIECPPLSSECPMVMMLVVMVLLFILARYLARSMQFIINTSNNRNFL